MSVRASSFIILESSKEVVFWEKPQRVIVNERLISPYLGLKKIETLIEELQKKGPLISLGTLGPAFFCDKPDLLTAKADGKEIYRWKPGSKHFRYAVQTYQMILGAIKSAEGNCVLFTLSEDVTPSSTSSIRHHRPSTTDPRIFVVSHNIFRDYLEDIYFPQLEPDLTKGKSVVQTPSTLLLDPKEAQKYS